MKGQSLCIVCVIAILLAVMIPRNEGYKNVSATAQNEIIKINTKILPTKALCVKGSQCQSGKCLTNANESLYGYCQ